MMTGDAIAILEASRESDGEAWGLAGDLTGHPDAGSLPPRWLAGLAGLALGMCIVVGALVF